MSIAEVSGFHRCQRGQLALTYSWHSEADGHANAAYRPGTLVRPGAASNATDAWQARVDRWAKLVSS